MKLAAGFRLGPYEITAPLGAGGMGEVYRARDHRLGREVAVKVLPAEVAADPDRLRRFEQEARAASALNHPNLLTIYDVGESGAQPYLVTELLEGRTLREWIESDEKLPLARVLDWGAQIANGLAAAHERGIVHRDLKPENLFVTRDGRIKILDFGLAKLFQPEGSAAGLAQATTIAGATGTGVILGTAGYMAPEQVRGAAVDARTDLFALGCVLYELLGGARAFHGASAIETLNAILKEEPRPLAELAGGVPVSVVRIVERCLAKEPANRFQSARDLAFALESVAPGAASGPLPAAAGARGMAARRRVIAATAGALLVALAAAGAWRWASGARAAPFTLQRLTFERGQITAARFVPGGGDVALTASWGDAPPHLYLKRADSVPSTSLESSDARLLAISSRGELALQLHARGTGPMIWAGTLARQTLGAGAPRELIEQVSVADWRPGSDELAIVVDSGDAQHVEFPPGRIRYRTAGWIGRLRFSPDGSRLAFFDHSSRNFMGGNLVLLAVASDEKKSFPVDPDGADLLGLAWRPDGREIWYGDMLGRLRAVDLAGHVRRLADLPLAVNVQDIAPDGRLLFLEVDRRMGTVFEAGPNAAPRELSWLQWSIGFALTRRGDRLLFTEITDRWAGPGRAALRSTAGGPVTELADGFAYALSPDEQSALIVRFGEETTKALLVPTGAGAPRELENGPIVSHNAGCFAPDGSWVAFVASTATSAGRLFTQSLAGGPPRQLNDEAIGFGPISISPDGAQIAAVGADGSLRLFPVSGGASRTVPGVRWPSGMLVWSADGRSVLIRSFAGVGPPVERADLTSGAVSPVRALRPPDPIGITFLGPVLTTPDERTWAYGYVRELATLYVASGLDAPR